MNSSVFKRTSTILIPQSEDGSTPIIAYLGKKIARRKMKGPDGKEFEVDENGMRVMSNAGNESSLAATPLKTKGSETKKSKLSKG